MGKIIVKNIRGMGWKAKVGLIALFTLVFSVSIYQGWNQLRNADAAIGMGTWTSIYNGTAFPNATSVSYTPSTGTNRLLVVSIAANRSAVGAITPTITFGGQTLTLANGDMTSATPRQHTAIYYLREAGIATALGAGSSANFSLTLAGGTANGAIIYATTLTNVDQTTPISNSQIKTASTTATAAPTFSANLASAANDKPIGIINSFRTASGTAYTLTASTNWTLPAAGNTTVVSGTTYAMRAGVFDRTIPTATTNSTTVGTISASSLCSMTGISVRAATTTLGNGAIGTSANVAPGAVDQKIDGFSFVTSSANTNDSITGLTVTTTNQAAIASMRITNEAGTTSYFGTVNNPGSDTWVFSGGTPIPVTGTAANYKILVTYKTRAGGAPAGSTATTARVTAYTSTNIQATGTDTADTTLTLLNAHAASTWGVNTAGNAQVVLNWSYGTAGQSVIIIRYTTNTDTTKPTDGVTTYTTGTAFGTGGTVVYNGAAATYTNTGLTNGSTYYYKIFEYDAFNNYYNASDVWTAALSPVSPDSIPPTVDAGFSATTPLNTLTIPITSFTATDNVGGSGVAGYLITFNNTQPTAAAIPGGAAPSSIDVASAGTYTLYPWVKDSGNNVSPLYGAPVTVVVDLTAPTVTAFTAPAQSGSSSIAINSFTASDTGGSGINGYMVTVSSTAPAANDSGWSGTPLTSYTVAVDGVYTLYPWVRDAAGNVSVAATPVTVLVDTTGPTGLTLVSPADESVARPLTQQLQCSTATDAGSGGVQYYFQISNDSGYAQNSGWIAGTTFSPTGLEQGLTYIWSVKAKDALGNESAFTTPRTFTTTAPCVRNNPTLTLLTPGGSKASTISTEAGTSVYNLSVRNNDFGDCGPTTFNLSVTDEDLDAHFGPSALGVASLTIDPQFSDTTTVTANAKPAEDTGIENTTVTAAADAYHAAVTTSRVQTTLNVVTCRPSAPLLIAGPDSGYVNKNGKKVYTITVKNTDLGAGCLPVVYNLGILSDSDTSNFDPSVLSASLLSLNAGELTSATLTVSAKSSGVRNSLNITTLQLSAAGHASPANAVVKTTINNPMLHNSDNTGSSKWSSSGGWGTPNGRYGEIDCNTCHVGGGGDTVNVKRINTAIFTPSTTNHKHFPGEGQPVAYRRYVGDSASKPVLGYDGSATPRTSSSKICEVCHTYDSKSVNGVKAHPYSSYSAGVPKTLTSHFGTDGTDCTRCHKHNQGFAGATGMCNTCHGDSTFAGQINELNRYYVAPPKNKSGVTGTLTGLNEVSNDPKVGAHQTHLRMTLGFSSYSTIDFRCASCHGPVPTGMDHANDSAAPVFQGLATRGGMSPTFNATGRLTCANTYCHNPAASGILKKATNTGSSIFPSWTSAKLLGDTRRTQANCGVCHKSPGDAGFEPAGTHNGMTIANQSCVGCHGHDGDGQGPVGKRHMDGKLFGAGACNSCHGYLPASWSLPATPVINVGGAGAHAVHLTYLTTKLNTVTLNPDADSYAGAADSWVKVCAVCHDNVATKHMDNTVDVTLNNAYFFGTTGSPTYSGTPGGAGSKSCSNLSCHYFTTPLWSN